MVQWTLGNLYYWSTLWTSMIQIESSMFGSHCKHFFECLNMMKMLLFTWKDWFIYSPKKKLLNLFLKCLLCDYSNPIFFMFRIDKSNDGYASYRELVNFGTMLVKLRFFSFLILIWHEIFYCLFLFLGRNPRYWWSRCGSRESCFNYVCCLWSWQNTKNKQGTIYKRVCGNICLFLLFIIFC